MNFKCCDKIIICCSFHISFVFAASKNCLCEEYCMMPNSECCHIWENLSGINVSDYKEGLLKPQLHNNLPL